MVTIINCQDDDISSAFATPELGKKHLLTALDSGDRQIFISALHDVIDAIVEEIESEMNSDRYPKEIIGVLRAI